MDFVNTSLCIVYKQGSPGQFVGFMLCHICGNGIVHRHACSYHITLAHSCDISQEWVNVMYIFKW